jgi:hypothetical protein
VYNHGLPQADIDAVFAASGEFFALPDDAKARTPFSGWNGGWEKEQQARCGPLPPRLLPPRLTLTDGKRSPLAGC